MSAQPTVEPLSVGVWLSVKKWNEMKNAGLFNPDAIMTAPQLLEDFIPEPTTCPIKYHQLDTEGSSLLSQQQVVEGQATVEKGSLGQFEALLHKNSETMANSIYFQIQSSLDEYSALLKSIEDQTVELTKVGKKLVLVDNFKDVERTLDRCEIYNAMMEYVPVGEGPTAYDSMPVENRKLLKTPLTISLPPSVLLYQPIRDDNDRGSQPPSSPQTFDISQVVEQQSQYKQLALCPENALGVDGVAQYPLFFDQNGDGLDTTFKFTPKTDLKPSILCLKSPLSSGSSISHAMLLTHNAVQSKLVKNQNGDDQNSDQNVPPPTQFQPPSALYTLPPGLHLLTHVSPHHKVYKVYVVGDAVSIECRDSIDLKGIHQRSYLTQQSLQFKKLCDYAADIFKKHPKPHQDPEVVKGFRDFSMQLQDEYKIFCQNQAKLDLASPSQQQQEPVSLYFNSQYMKMHMYTGSTEGDLLHPDPDQLATQTSPHQLPTISNDKIDTYLHRVLDGSVQPLLSIFPNPITRNDDKDSLVFDKDILYPTIPTLYNNYPTNSIPIKDTIYLSQRQVIPPYLPAPQTFEHARSESVVTSSEAWARHIIIRKMLKSLWKVEDGEKKNQGEDKVEEDCKNGQQNDGQQNDGPIRIGLPDLKDDNNQDTKDFKDTITAMARLLQERIGLTLFGFDVVQNYYTRNLTVIDVNYFPTYSSVNHLPTRVAVEVLKKYGKETGQ